MAIFKQLPMSLCDSLTLKLAASTPVCTCHFTVVKIAFHAPFSSPFLDFSTLYIHYFVYTVYDDFGGC